jgi:parallel beta-helix repeat protein
MSNNNILTVTGIGIRLASSNYAVVTGNVINGATTNSIYLTSADFNTVTDNKIYNGGGSGSSDGIYLASTGNDSNYIVNNSIYDTAGTGQAVDIDGGTSNTIAGNIYSGTGATALELASGVVQTGQLDSSSNIIYNPTGNFGINTTGPDAKLDILATSGEQLRLSYTDGSVYTGFTVDSGGDLTVNGTGNDVNFSDAINGTFVNSAAGSANALSLSGTLGAFDGSDTFRGVYLNYTNANHAGTSNVFNGLDIAGITGDAEATETALNIGAGWDSGITSASAITISGGADLNITAATDLVFGGTTTLGEATSATDSGAYLVGVFDEFTYSSSSTVQAVLNDLDAAISSSGDITDVGSCSTGACFVDGTNNTLTFEGSATDTFESVLSATNPTADRSF